MGQATIIQAPSPAETPQVPEGTDLIEWYYERGYSDGLPLVPPCRRKSPRSSPRWGSLTRDVLAINMVMADCRPEYAPVVEASAIPAST